MRRTAAVKARQRGAVECSAERDNLGCAAGQRGVGRVEVEMVTGQTARVRMEMAVMVMVVVARARAAVAMAMAAKAMVEAARATERAAVRARRMAAGRAMLMVAARERRERWCNRATRFRSPPEAPCTSSRRHCWVPGCRT